MAYPDVSSVYISMAPRGYINQLGSAPTFASQDMCMFIISQLSCKNVKMINLHIPFPSVSPPKVEEIYLPIAVEVLQKALLRFLWLQ